MNDSSQKQPRILEVQPWTLTWLSIGKYLALLPLVIGAAIAVAALIFMKTNPRVASLLFTCALFSPLLALIGAPTWFLGRNLKHLKIQVFNDHLLMRKKKSEVTVLFDDVASVTSSSLLGTIFYLKTRQGKLHRCDSALCAAG